MKTLFWFEGKILKEYEDFRDLGLLPRIGDTFTIKSLTSKKSITHYGNGEKREASWLLRVEEVTFDLINNTCHISLNDTICDIAFPCNATGYVRAAMNGHL